MSKGKREKEEEEEKEKEKGRKKEEGEKRKENRSRKSYLGSKNDADRSGKKIVELKKEPVGIDFKLVREEFDYRSRKSYLSKNEADRSGKKIVELKKLILPLFIFNSIFFFNYISNFGNKLNEPVRIGYKFVPEEVDNRKKALFPIQGFRKSLEFPGTKIDSRVREHATSSAVPAANPAAPSLTSAVQKRDPTVEAGIAAARKRFLLRKRAMVVRSGRKLQKGKAKVTKSSAA